MKLGEYEVTERKCPVCGKDCETMLFSIDAWDCGFLKANNSPIDEEDVEVISVEALWKDGSNNDAFQCPHCKTRLTGSLDEAKRFMVLGAL